MYHAFRFSHIPEQVLQTLKEAFPVPDVIYWVLPVLPVLRSGRLSDET